MRSDTSGRPARLWRNPLSLAGAAIALLSLANALFLVLVILFSARPNPYLGIFAYVVLPAVALLGVVLIPLGMAWERRRRLRLPGEAFRYPTIDLNQPAQRRAFGVALVAGALFLVASVAASRQAYEYSESVPFCGELCHQPMRPQFAAYRVSPHARVPCVECHVGPGARSYIEAKLSGTRQLYAVLFDAFPRPIHALRSELQPARNTCEQCHWPDKYWGNVLRVFTHFAADEANSPREVRLLVKVGGGNPAVGPVGGIHWHMNLDNTVTYIATDERAQEIPWVKTEARDGTVTEYLLAGSDLTPDRIATSPKRRMDCIDCHNRPTHVFRPPNAAVDEALAAGRIDRALPFVKRQAVEALAKGYETTTAALEAIRRDLPAFYEQEHPKVYAGKRDAIEQAVAEVRRIYATSIFPEMRTDWRSHPDNIGHLTSPGCFRCHDGRHASADGKVIGNECATCHVTVEQREGSRVLTALQGQAFRHPVDVGDLKEAPCSQCHTWAGGP